jgi:hypothetical protein
MVEGPARRKIIPVDFFSHGHRVSTQINVYGWPLSAQLNDRRSEWFDLEVAYVSRIEHLGEIITDFPMSILRKNDIAFALLASQIEGAIKKPAVSGFVRYWYRTLVAVPSFEITGMLEGPAKLDLHVLLAAGAERFFPVRKPSITLSTDPGVRLTGELALINMDKVEFICAEDRGEPASES